MTVLKEVSWPVGEQPPALPGFVGSSFSPLAAAVAERCLEQVTPQPGTGVLLVSRSGDEQSARHVRQVVESGDRLGPLYFFQSVPNSVAGQIAARWQLDGPVVCLSPVADPRAEALAQAALLIADGDADRVLVVLIEQNPDGAAALLVSGGETR
ncbi:beta-ketoacyl synthase chain length factor [Kribbella deserti]|uniref:Beta-ketoacyl synthase chain length factor n=1 Tax=Kribbella deserti TaxID=1926257 RepID=A0ABV6QWB6_9ACTN